MLREESAFIPTLVTTHPESTRRARQIRSCSHLVDTAALGPATQQAGVVRFPRRPALSSHSTRHQKASRQAPPRTSPPLYDLRVMSPFESVSDRAGPCWIVLSSREFAIWTCRLGPVCDAVCRRVH